MSLAPCYRNVDAKLFSFFQTFGAQAEILNESDPLFIKIETWKFPLTNYEFKLIHHR